MKYRTLIPLFTICLIIVTLTVIIISIVNNLIVSNYNGATSKQAIVNYNDVVKSAQDYLRNKEVGPLNFAIRKYGYDLTLCDIKGIIVFDSKNKRNIGNKVDLNDLQSEADNIKKIFTVSHTTKGNEDIDLAIINTNEKKLSINELKARIVKPIWFLSVIFIMLSMLMFLLIYINILKPFKRLEAFASEVAKGNLEIPLVQHRHNLFGAFTWAFDMLRNELKSTKELEAEAQHSKKELVAVLSHDIRTPIASIKAYAECLKSLTEKNSERSDRYIEVIIKKSDEITKLSQDLFMHAISDLEKLEIETGEFLSRELLNNIIEPLILQYDNRILVTSAIPDINIITDQRRLAQVFENIISNSAKYAPESDIYIECTIVDGMLKCNIKDLGKGVLPEDIPFLFDKFFRGKNAKEGGQTGSGLGLYISKYILEKTGGQIKAYNYSENDKKGFEVEISLRIV